MARLIIAQVSGFWKHVPPSAFGPMKPELVKAFDILALWSYLPISARMGALALGVLAAMAVSDERWRQNIARWVATLRRSCNFSAVFGPMTPQLVSACNILALWSYLPISARMGALGVGRAHCNGCQR